MKHAFVILGLLAINASLAHATIICDLLPSASGPAAGGNTLVITNYAGAFGSGSDITNLVFSNATQSVATTNVPAGAQGTNWVRVVVPAHSAGTVDITIQSASLGNTVLANAYIFSDPTYQWHTFFGADTADRAYSITIDAHSNAYITGRSKTTWNGPMGQHPLHGHSSSGIAADAVILKLDKDGAYQWHTFYGTSIGDEDGVDYAYAVALDGNTNVYITGFSYGTWNGPTGEPPIQAYSGGSWGGDSKAFILKLDSAGTYQWHTFYGAGSGTFDEGRGIALDESANVYVAMKSEVTWDGPGSTAPLHAYSGDTDITVLKLNKDGAYRWHTFYGTANADECFSIAIDSGANIYVAGYSEQTWNGPSDQSPRHAYAGGWDIITLKLDDAGTYQWHTFYGSDSANDEGKGLVVDGQTNIYITGRSAATWQGDGNISPIHPYAGNDDIMLLKLNGAGAYQWHSFYGSASANDYGLDVALDGNTNVHVIGRSHATWNGDGTTGPIHSYAGSADIMVLNLYDTGAYRWHTFYGSASGDYGQDMALDTQGRIYIAGYSSATWLGGNGSDPLHTYVGGDDIVALVLSAPMPSLAVFGTNGTTIASGETASVVKGTDFGTFALGKVPVTKTFAISNSGNIKLTISGVATSGLQSSAFSLRFLPSTVAAGMSSNFAIVFNPNVAGVATASFAIANNSTSTPYVINVKGKIGRTLNDYDGDGKSDLCLYQGSTGRWYAKLSGNQYSTVAWIGDVGMGWTPVPGDYDGDGLTDVAAYNLLSGQWLVRFSSSGLLGDCWLGGAEFTAAQSDFDGDAMTDPLVYREADGYWLGRASSRQYAQCFISFGETGYQSVIADYDGDGLADPAVYNRTTGFWAISLSGSGYTLRTGIFGGAGYLPVTADYDGDGLADPAVYEAASGTWQALMSGSAYTLAQFILQPSAYNLQPVPADYDGDGKADPAVYHQDNGLWELFLSTQGYQLVWGNFGGPEYQPALE